jgi:hypothetical protein
MNYRQILFIVFIAALSSCKKQDEYPVIPAIDFKNIYTEQFNGLDENATIILNFTDGDGDIGYKEAGQNDTIFDNSTSPYYHNYVATLEIFRNNVWKDTALASSLGGRIPYLTPEGKNKALKGEIACEIPLVGLVADEDTFRFKIFIYDRALHKSNDVTTASVVINTQ